MQDASLLESTYANTPTRSGLHVIALICISTACAPTPNEAGESVQALTSTDRGHEITQHPNFDAVSQHADELLANVTEALSTMSEDQVRHLQQSLEQCDPATDCQALLEQLSGTELAALTPIVEAVARIQFDVGLANASASDREEAFRYAQYLSDGEGADAAFLERILPNPGLPCTSTEDCPTFLGNMVGSVKADYLVELAAAAQPASPKSKTRKIGPAVLVPVFAAYVAVWSRMIIWAEDMIYNSNESEKECVHDTDCADDEYCHRLGDNDCRPRRDQGALCHRHTQCASNCCRWHWFVLQCRPADRCN